MSRVYWIPGSIEVLNNEAQLAFFHDAVLRGTRPYRFAVDTSFHTFGVCNNSGRDATFIFRGARRHLLYEVDLGDQDIWTRLGPCFGAANTTCVVVQGYEGVRAVCDAWLGGGDLQSVLRATTFLNRRDMAVLTPLEWS